MKLKNSLLVGIVALSIIASCKKHETPPVIEKGIVYVSGYTVTTPSSIEGAYWKNGILTKVAGTQVINAITVSGNDVYMLGANGYWKNGTYTDLGTNSALSSMYISNGDIYVAGRLVINDTATAAYWKNGTPVILSSKTDTSSYVDPGIYVSGFRFSQANSIFVSGIDVYAAGYVTVMGTDVVAYWKNGKAIYLTNPLESYSRANSISASGDDVYIAGWLDDYSNAYVTYWKNGVSTYFGSHGGEASSVSVSGNNVYIAGYINNAGYSAAAWENGVLTMLPNGYTTSGITVSGSDIYVCGRTNNNEAVYWKNDTAHILGTGGATGISIGN